MTRRDSSAPAQRGTPSQDPTREDRLSAAIAFEMWQRQWPALFRGEAWLHLQRLKHAIAEPETGRERKTP